MSKAVAYAGGAILFLTLLLAIAMHLSAFEAGLAARYSAENGGGGTGAASGRVDRPPFSTALHSPPIAAPAFNVTWTGQLWVPASGTYTLGVNADTGTSLFVDGHAVFDNVRTPEDQFASRTITLSRGGHAIFVAYAHREGGARLELLWGRDGEALQPVAASALQPERAGAARVAVIGWIERAPVVLAWLWASELTALWIALIGAAAAAGKRLLARAGMWRELRWVLAGSFALTVTAIWWGLPAPWVPIELTPTFVIDGLSRWYSHGWSDAYPPLQYYILSAAISPLVILQRYAGVDAYGVAGHTVMVMIFRAITCMLATGLVACAGLCAAQIGGKRAGLIAAAVFALTTPFVFYGKTGNVDVPYLFWFGVSMVLYLRMLEELRMRDFVLFAAAAACAVCTKDQAYGFYVLVPVAVIARVWMDNRARGAAHPLARTLVDRRIGAAALTAAVLFAAIHNFPFNFQGFKDHLAFIVGPGSQGYEVFKSTAAGRVALLVLTIRLIRESMGWPMFVIGLAGLALALIERPTRRAAIWLVIPAVSYYIFFIDVILYNYDRFVMPMCFVLAACAGMAVDRLLTRARTARVVSLATAAVALAFAYTLLYAGTVDALMLNDSRYDAQRWMRAHIGDSLVGVTELPELLPDVSGYRTVAVATVEELQREKPRFFILNSDYARAADPAVSWSTLLNGLRAERLGYRVVAHFRSGSPWPWLPWAHPDLVGPRTNTSVTSVLRDINPTIDIFERD